MIDPECLARALHATDTDWRGTKWEGLTEPFKAQFRERARKMIEVMDAQRLV